MKNPYWTVQEMVNVAKNMPIEKGECFMAVFESGEIMTWYKPQTWTHVFKTAKFAADIDMKFGLIYSIDYTGKRRMIRFLGDIWEYYGGRAVEA